MIPSWAVPGLLETGPLDEQVLAIRDAVVNMFVVKGTTGPICVDSGWRPAVVARGFASLALDPRHVQAVFLTHTHWDHARAAGIFPCATIYIGEDEPVSPKHRTSQKVRDGQVLMVAGLSVRVVATPGHTLGSVSYVIADRLLFTGDLLRLRRGKVVPNFRFLTRDRPLMLQSIRKLSGIARVECLLTGHCGWTRRVDEAFQEFRTATQRDPCRSS